MNKNVGTADRVFRIILGLALLSLIHFLDGNVRWIGLAGLIFIGTALVGFCPLYTLFGIKTCPVKE